MEPASFWRYPIAGRKLLVSVESAILAHLLAIEHEVTLPIAMTIAIDPKHPQHRTGLHRACQVSQRRHKFK